MPDMNHAIYIPAPKNITTRDHFTAVTFDGDKAKKQSFAWGADEPGGKVDKSAIAAQKKGYMQIAGPAGTALALQAKMISKKNKKATSKEYTVENSIIYQSPRGGALSDLRGKPNTVLYIDCHGNGNSVGYRPYGFNAEELAKLMVYEGLPKNIKMIKVLACFSGEEADTSAGERTGNIFACQFSAYLYERGYHGVKVYGYIGEVKVAGSGERNCKVYFDKDLVKGKDARREFVDGKMTADAVALG